MTNEEFDALRRDYDVIPFVREMSADALTPVAAFSALSAKGEEAFLFESVERGENVGRYSFVGFDVRRDLRLERGAPDPIGTLNRELIPLRVFGEERLPPFFGGAVAYFGYGVGGWFERIPDTLPDDLKVPDATLLFFNNVVVFDHVRQRLFVVVNIFTADKGAGPENAEKRLSEAIRLLRGAHVDLISFPEEVPAADFRTTFTQAEFEAVVSRAKEEIVAGEIYQIVLSQRWDTDFDERNALTLYRALRSINPSPYMFLLRTNECTLVGASPEMLVRVTGNKAETRPIAGTRPRGATRDDDARLEKSLLADPKENAEHLMLVDLGRNDLGRVCRSGSVEVMSFRRIERYSHVIHLVSDVEGVMRDDRSPIDVFLSCFPAGTVSGAPKIRAMELIDQMEKTRRGPYAGAVAYIGFSGNLDSCITIRTIVLANGRAYVQAGAGIVFDSDPAYEFQESINKAGALRRAIEVAKAMRSASRLS
ncbi:MAG TPA: chorismate-binding protein [Thermoanaerobaculia bacterium]|nr:chorismate-binding protein [Thermoanaerobaculia bacterium]